MKLEHIELRNVGPFTSVVGVGPLADGLNVLTARNESGKTTLLMAAARALFDRHTVTGESIETLRPVGTSLAPEVTVAFVTAEGRFKIHKRFLNAPTSELFEDRNGDWHPMADGDAADGRVLDLIGGMRAGRGVSKAEHWGLLRYLWARQGDTADWPAWDDDAGARIRNGLAQVHLDPLVERLGNRFQDEQAQQFTGTGRVAKNSPLQQAQQALEQLETELTAVRARMEQCESQQQELQQLREELIVREREMADAGNHASMLTETLTKVELLRKDLDRFQGEFGNAQERLNAIHKEKASLRETAEGIRKAEEELVTVQAGENSARQEETGAIRELADFQGKAKVLREKLEITRRSETRLREIQELRGMEYSFDALRKQLATVRQQQIVLDQLRRKRAALPDVTKQQVTKLEQLEQALRDLRIRSEAVGLRVALTPKQDARVTADHDGAETALDVAAGESMTLKAARSLRLTLPGWGDLQISSGAHEAADIEVAIADKRVAMERQLKTLGVPSIDRARAAAEQIKDIQRDIQSAETRLTESLDDWDAPEALAAEADKTEAVIEKRRAFLNLSEAETRISTTELKTELATRRTAMESDEVALAMIQNSIETLGNRIESCRAAREKSSKDHNEIKNRIESLRSKVTTIEERYPDGIDKSEENFQSAFVNAKAQLDVSQKKMPQDWEKLGSRHERALKAAAETTKAFQDLQLRIHKVEMLLEQTGSQGLYSRETQLEESLAGAQAEVERLENRALAARFLAGLINYRKKQAVSTVLTPLEDQLSATFADISGVPNRRVFLDENLQVAGIGRKRDEIYAFNQLSQGAREQLLLALRAAVALELAKHGPQILILDDVLVNTDATRQQNVLDYIQTVAGQVQVLIVTCHGERYRGIGKSLGITPGAA